MPQRKKYLIKLQCIKCKHINYWSHRKPKPEKDKKLALKKFCKWCRKHTKHKEMKR